MSFDRTELRVIGVLLFSLPPLLFLAAAGELALTGRITPVSAALGLALSACLGAVLLRHERLHVSAGAGWRITLWSGAALTVSLLASAAVYDISYDGQAYHQEAIIQIAGGWNPFADVPLMDDTKDPPYFWINHYAKGPWLAAAALYNAIGRIECGKAINVLALAGSAILVYSLVRERLSGRKAKWFAVIAAINPVSLNQMLTYGNDGLLGSLLLGLVPLLAFVYVYGRRAYLLPAALAAILLVNVKFTGVVYAALAVGGFVVYAFLKNRSIGTKALFVWLAVGLFAAAGPGYNPYVTNFARDGHPFYPLAGEGKVDIVRSNMYPPFVDRGRLDKAFTSWFGKTSNQYDAMPVLKPPFTVTSSELAAMEGGDTRVGGFGPWFGAALLLSAVLAGYLAYARGNRQRAAAALTLFWLLGSVFVNPESWWARYVPQMWAVPLLAWLWGELEPLPRSASRLSAVLAAAITVNAAMSVAPNALYTAIRDQKLKKALAEMKAQSEKEAVRVVYNNFYSNRVRFQEKGIRVREATEGECRIKRSLPSSDTQWCVRGE